MQICLQLQICIRYSGVIYVDLTDSSDQIVDFISLRTFLESRHANL